MRPGRLSWIVAVPACLFVVGFAVIPIVVLLANSVGLGATGLHEASGFTLDYYRNVFTTAHIRRSMINSIIVSVAAVAFAMAIAIPVVLELARRNRAGRPTTVADTALTMPIALPGTVIGFFAIILIGNTGLLGQVFAPLAGASYLLPGVIAAYVYFSLPRVIGPLRGAAQNLDPAIPEAARSLGASRWRVFRTITWPLLLPAIIESSGTALAIALGGYGTIAALSQGVRLLPLDVVDSLSAAGYNVATASATAVVLATLAVSFMVFGQLGSRWLLRDRTAPSQEVTRQGAVAA